MRKAFIQVSCRNRNCLLLKNFPITTQCTMELSAYVAIGAVLLAVVYLLMKKLKVKKNTTAVKPGTVVLHQFIPTPLVVNGSPPCLKLETFLRVAKIPYENQYGMNVSKKGKMPWISFNGQEIADSNFCIRFLNKELKMDIDSHLSSSERAIAHCIRTMLEENTYWALVYYRWLSPHAENWRELRLGKHFRNLLLPLKYILFYIIQRKNKGDLWCHGIGRHSEEELYGIAERDLFAVSMILGQKEFLFGEKPCLADVSLFAFIAGSCWEHPASPFAELTKSKMQNLEEHAQRIKKLYYPDWDEITSKGSKPMKPWDTLYSLVIDILLPLIV